MLKVFGDDVTLDIDKGQVRLSTKIRDRDGAIIAELVANDWKVNQQRAFDRNYSRSAIEVRDAGGDIVLQARVLKDRVQLAARFYDRNGNAVVIGKVKGPDGKIGGAIEVRHGGQQIQMIIEPMFRYPSDLHLGELVAKSKPRTRARYKTRRVRPPPAS